MTGRAAVFAAALAIAVCGCGSSAGLHVEQGGRTVAIAPPPSEPSPPPKPHSQPGRGIHLGAPAAIAYADGTLWCAVQPGGARLIGSLIRVDTTSGRVTGAPVALPPAAAPYLVSAGADGLWLAAGRVLRKVDPATGASSVTVRLPGLATAVLDSAGSIWLTVSSAGGGRLVRVDPRSGTVLLQPVGPQPTALTAAFGSVWVADGSAQSIRRFTIHPTALRPAGTVRLPRSPDGGPTAITVYGNAVWAYEPGRILRIDLTRDVVLGTTVVARAPGGTIAAGAGGVWVVTRTSTGRGAVALVDAVTGSMNGRAVPVSGSPSALATDGRSVWVLDGATGQLARVYP